MVLSRRNFMRLGAVQSALALGSFLTAGMVKPSGLLAFGADDKTDEMTPPATGANGLFIQPWFEDGFLDLTEEIGAAQDQGRQLIILYEQAGCPYCKELHRVNLTDPKISKFMQEHFRVVQLDIRGSREVTDFEGKVMSEREFSQKWQIHFTPTLSFFPTNKALVLGKSGRSAEAFRLTGYWKPFHFETVLRFVHDGSYKTKNLQVYLKDRIKKLKKLGLPTKIWN